MFSYPREVNAEPHFYLIFNFFLNVKNYFLPIIFLLVSLTTIIKLGQLNKNVHLQNLKACDIFIKQTTLIVKYVI